MNDRGKSDGRIVPGKSPNKGSGAPESAEGMEGRRSTKGNPDEQNRPRTQCRNYESSLSHALERIRKAALRDRKQKFTALWHHVYSTPTLVEAFRGLSRNATAGVDEVTWREYEENLLENLIDLSDRLRRGAYRVKPVKRAYIPKPDGRQRPIGVTTLEDKIVQRAVTMVLSAVYEVDFKGFSYGFRPKRSAHNALDALSVGITTRKVSWILDADIRGFFDAINHEWMIRFIEHRIADKRMVRQIKKWLTAGVLEDGNLTHPEEGTPQGGSISPLLANIYLHYAFDEWVHLWRKKQTCGDVIVVRYADDFVVGFQNKGDAERFRKHLEQRLRKFNLELHSDKTRLIEFGRFAARDRSRRGEGKPETFDFLGFTHICHKSWKNGRFIVRRKPMAKRVAAKLVKIKERLMRWRNLPVPFVGKWLRSVLTGWYRYFAVPMTSHTLHSFRKSITRLWLNSLRRRSHRHKLTWERMTRLAEKWLPHPRILHPYPWDRLRVDTQGRSPVR